MCIQVCKLNVFLITKKNKFLYHKLIKYRNLLLKYMLRIIVMTSIDMRRDEVVNKHKIRLNPISMIPLFRLPRIIVSYRVYRYRTDGAFFQGGFEPSWFFPPRQPPTTLLTKLHFAVPSVREVPYVYKFTTQWRVTAKVTVTFRTMQAYWDCEWELEVIIYEYRIEWALFPEREREREREREFSPGNIGDLIIVIQVSLGPHFPPSYQWSYTCTHPRKYRSTRSCSFRRIRCAAPGSLHTGTRDKSSCALYITSILSDNQTDADRLWFHAPL